MRRPIAYHPMPALKDPQHHWRYPRSDSIIGDREVCNNARLSIFPVYFIWILSSLSLLVNYLSLRYNMNPDEAKDKEKTGRWECVYDESFSTSHSPSIAIYSFRFLSSSTFLFPVNNW